MYTQNPPNSFTEAINLTRSYILNFHATMPQAVSSVRMAGGLGGSVPAGVTRSQTVGVLPSQITSIRPSTIQSGQRSVEISQIPQALPPQPQVVTSKVMTVPPTLTNSVQATSLPPSNSRIIISSTPFQGNSMVRPMTTTAPSGSRLIIQQPLLSQSQIRLQQGGSRIIIQGQPGVIPSALSQTMNLTQLRQQEWRPATQQNSLIASQRSSSHKVLTGVPLNQSFSSGLPHHIRPQALNQSVGSIVNRPQALASVTGTSSSTVVGGITKVNQSGPLQFSNKRVSQQNSAQAKPQTTAANVTPSAFILPSQGTTTKAPEQPLTFGVKKYSAPETSKTQLIGTAGFKQAQKIFQAPSQTSNKNIPAQVVNQSTNFQKTEINKATTAATATNRATTVPSTNKGDISGPKIIRLDDKTKQPINFESAQKVLKKPEGESSSKDGPGTPGFK